MFYHYFESEYAAKKALKLFREIFTEYANIGITIWVKEDTNSNYPVTMEFAIDDTRSWGIVGNIIIGMYYAFESM